MYELASFAVGTVTIVIKIFTMLGLILTGLAILAPHLGAPMRKYTLSNINIIYLISKWTDPTVFPILTHLYIYLRDTSVL